MNVPQSTVTINAHNATPPICDEPKLGYTWAFHMLTQPEKDVDHPCCTMCMIYWTKIAPGGQRGN